MSVWPSRPRPPTTEQVQCPGCGARGATAELELRDPRTGQVVPKGTGLANLAGVAALFLLGNLANAIYGAASPVPALCLTLGLTAVVWLGAMFWLTRRQTRAARIHRYKCLTCGYRWEWREGEPLPERAE
jgi:DNA-directed RNA polymerase subunit RPC12/RpoP